MNNIIKKEMKKNLNIIVDYILENEYKNFQENCECDIDICVDNWEDCECQPDHIYYVAQKISHKRRNKFNRDGIL